MLTQNIVAMLFFYHNISTLSSIFCQKTRFPDLILLVDKNRFLGKFKGSGKIKISGLFLRI